jgi:two-component sensor histidine kinase
VFAIAVDIDDLKRATERQSVLLAELQHRVRNIMSTIHAIAWRTRVGGQRG